MPLTPGRIYSHPPRRSPLAPDGSNPWVEPPSPPDKPHKPKPEGIEVDTPGETATTLPAHPDETLTQPRKRTASKRTTTKRTSSTRKGGKP